MVPIAVVQLLLCCSFRPSTFTVFTVEMGFLSMLIAIVVGGRYVFSGVILWFQNNSDFSTEHFSQRITPGTQNQSVQKVKN